MAAAMSLYTLGLNHQTAPLDVREQVVFSPDALGHALRDLLTRPKVKEAAILSTCNRTEVYVHGTEPQSNLGKLVYVKDNNTVALTADTTNTVCCGVMVQPFISTSECWVNIDQQIGSVGITG